MTITNRIVRNILSDKKSRSKPMVDLSKEEMNIIDEALDKYPGTTGFENKNMKKVAQIRKKMEE